MDQGSHRRGGENIHIYMKGYIFKAELTEFAEVLDLRCDTRNGIMTDCSPRLLELWRQSASQGLEGFHS